MEQTAKRGSLRQSPNRLNAVPAQSRSEEGGSVAGGGLRHVWKILCGSRYGREYEP